MSGDAIGTAVKSFRAALAGAGVMSLAINLLMLTGPMFMLQVYDRVLTSRSVPTLLALAGIAISLYAFFGFLETVRGRVLSRVGTRLDEQLTGHSFLASVHLPTMVRADASAPEPTKDLETVRQFLSGPGPGAIFDLPWLPLYVAVVFLLHPVLGLLASAAALVMCVLIGLNELAVRRPMQEASGRTSARSRLLEASRRNADSAIAMGMAGNLRDKWTAETGEFHTVQAKASDRGGFFSSFIKTFRFILQSSVLGVGAYLAILEEITPGVMIAASIITARAVAPIEQAVSQWRMFVSARQAFARLKQILPKMKMSEPQTELPLPKDRIAAEALWVAAPGSTEAIVKNVGFEMKKGEVLGLIGPSNSGKSTLGKALVGVWKPSRGVVRADGFDIAQWDQTRLGQCIGYLPQDIQLFAGTVAQNIARFQPDAPAEAIQGAAQLAGAEAMIAQLPDGYDTHIGEAGTILSGGQRQRIALARAVYGNPFLVVLDEPNSNLDGDGEKALTQALKALKEQGAITVVIAHRPSAIAMADTLMVLKEGEVAAYGPRDEILAQTRPKSEAEARGLTVVPGDGR